MTRLRRRSLPPRVLDIDAPQLGLKSPDDDDDDGDASDAGAAAASGARAPLTDDETEVVARLRRNGFRGSEAFVRRLRSHVEVIVSVLDELEAAPNEEWVRWRNPGGLINHLVTEALGLAGDRGASSGADQRTVKGRRATGPRAGTDRRRRRTA